MENIFSILDEICQAIDKVDMISADNFCKNITSILMIPEEYEHYKKIVEECAPDMTDRYLEIKPHTLDVNTESLDVLLQSETYDFNYQIALIISHRITTEFFSNEKQVYIHKFIRKFLKSLSEEEYEPEEAAMIATVLLELQLT
jgi:hypothetical protein